MHRSLILAATLAAANGAVGAATAMHEFDAAYAQAEEAQAQAASASGEWRDVGKLMQAAKKAAAAGEVERALELAAEARLHGELGYQQAIAQRQPDTTSFAAGLR